jgi:hypothetical protein
MRDRAWQMNFKHHFVRTVLVRFPGRYHSCAYAWPRHDIGATDSTAHARWTPGAHSLRVGVFNLLQRCIPAVFGSVELIVTPSGTHTPHLPSSRCRSEWRSESVSVAQGDQQLLEACVTGGVLCFHAPSDGGPSVRRDDKHLATTRRQTVARTRMCGSPPHVDSCAY